MDDMDELTLYTILGNACPVEVQEEWSKFELDLHCMRLEVWCRFEGQRVIVQEWKLVDC